MVRPMTVYGRRLSIIRTSCNDNSVDQYEHVHLSLKRFDRKQDIKNDGLTMTYNHLNSVQTEEQNTENSSEDEIKRIPNEYATLVKKDNHDLPDADDIKEYDKIWNLVIMKPKLVSKNLILTVMFLWKKTPKNVILKICLNFSCYIRVLYQVRNTTMIQLRSKLKINDMRKKDKQKKP